MARRKMWTLMGHSNGEGFAGSSPMLTKAPWLLPYGGIGSPSNGQPFTPTIERRVYPGIYMWTAKAGWSASGGTPPDFTPGAGTFLPLTLELPTSPNFPHPYTSPYNYPNNKSMPLSPPRYGATAATSAFAEEGGGGTSCGIELPLSWKLSHYWDASVYVMKLSLPSSLFMRWDQGLWLTAGLHLSGIGISPTQDLSAHYAWWTPADRFDWAPNTGRLYETWKARMMAAATEAAAAGDKLDVRFVLLWLGDNDALYSNFYPSTTPSRVREFEPYYRNFIAQVRQDLVDNDWTALPAHKIPVIGMGIQRAYGSTPTQQSMNNALDNIAKDDPYFRKLDTNNYRTLYQDGYTDLSHIGHSGYLAAAEEVFDAYVEMETFAEDALQRDNRVTFSEVKDRVLTYYERNRTQTNAQVTALEQHINGALFHILNKVSDGAWWLRQIHPISISGGPTTVVTLPRTVHRILRIERSGDPTYPLKFEMMGFTDAGRMQILMKESYVGTYQVHYITVPKEMTRDEELVPLPYNLVEWLVVESVRRLARSSGNVAMQESLMLEAKQLQDDCMRNIAAVRRPANDRVFGQRRLPSRRAYGRRWWGY